MPAPAAYLDITSVPYSRTVTQAEFNAGTYGNGANEVFFRYVASAQLSLGGYTARVGSTFIPKTQIYASDGTTVLHTISGSNPGSNAYSWSYLFSAGTYYVRVTNAWGSSSPVAGADFTFIADTRAVLASIPHGSTIINDDAGGFPALVVQTDGTVTGILPQVPAGETGDALPTGQMVWHSTFFPTEIKAFDSTLTLIAELDDDVASFALFCHTATNFYVFGNRGSGKAFKITPAGVMTQVATLGGFALAARVNALGVNRAGTVLYYITGGIGAPNTGVIYRWDLVNDIALTDFYTIAGYAAGDEFALTASNGNPGDILTLLDDTIVTFAYDLSSDLYSILHIDTDGALLHQYTYAGYGGTYGLIDHLAHDTGDPASIRVWFYKDSTQKEARFQTIRLSDGVATATADFDMFSAGVNQHADSAILFAPSNSCTMVAFEPMPPPEVDLSEPCCPCDCPAPTKDGTPARTPLPTHTGPIIPPVELSWDRNCSGGGTVPTASDPVDVESWVS